MRIDKDNIKILLILLVVSIGIGYAYINSDLNINGVANIRSANWNIHWENVQVTEGSVTANTPVIDTAMTTVSYTVTLSEPGDFYEFTVDATNDGTLDAMIGSISSKLNNVEITSLPNYLSYSATYENGDLIVNNQELKSGQTETYKLRIGYRNDITAEELPSTDQTLNLSFSIVYRQSDDTAITRFSSGTYVNLIPDSSSYVISTTLSGYSSDQTLIPNELTLWRVIGTNSDGSFDAVSEYVSSIDVKIKGHSSYTNLPIILQTIADQYSKENYTTSTRIMGYDNQTPTISDTSDYDGSRYNTGPMAATYPQVTTTPSPTEGIGQEYNGGLGGDTLYLKDYQLVSNAYKDDSTNYGDTGLKAYRVGTTTARKYWLASRYTKKTTTTLSWSARSINISGTLSNDFLRYCSKNNGCNWNESTITSTAIRPIITIKSSVKTDSGSGTKESPYVFK